MTNVWIIDDEESIRTICTSALEDLFNVESFSSASEALLALNSTTPDLIITDIKMPGMSGLEFLDKISEKFPDIPTIIITAHANIDNALSAYKGGAFEYLTKPFDINEIRKLAIKATKSSKPQHDELTQESNSQIVGKAESMQEVFKAIGKISKTDITVLIRGESGTGKELIAQSVHENSSRSKEPFIAINVAAIPHELLESELFGHEKGSFTGATENKEGKFELANKSSLLLDEVTEMSPPLQAKLLRVLQEHEVDKIGGKAPIPVDVRVIATSNRDIRKRIQEQEFREDLYYRLNVVPINLIPLRERIDDIPVLVENFINQFCQANGKSSIKIDSATLTLLKKYRWPGNIRELGNIVERSCLICEGDTILPSHLFFDEKLHENEKEAPRMSGTIYEMEKELIIQTLEEVNGNKTKAADSLGISIRTLRNKLNEYKSTDL